MQKNLYDLRQAAKMTQNDVAVKLGISTHAYNRKERGITQFTANEMLTLSKLFSQLMFLKGTKKRNKKGGVHMANKIQLFSFHDQQVRTLSIEAEPYFVGKDVADILG